MTDLSSKDLITCMSAIIKCNLLNGFVKRKTKLKLCLIQERDIPKASQMGYITAVIPFGFSKMTNEEELELLDKLHEAEQIAYLKENRG
jgi:hypothetical protein